MRKNDKEKNYFVELSLLVLACVVILIALTGAIIVIVRAC